MVLTERIPPVCYQRHTPGILHTGSYVTMPGTCCGSRQVISYDSARIRSVESLDRNKVSTTYYRYDSRRHNVNAAGVTSRSKSF